MASAFIIGMPHQYGIVIGEYLYGIRQSRFRDRYESWPKGLAVSGLIGSIRANGLPERVISTHSPSSIHRAMV